MDEKVTAPTRVIYNEHMDATTSERARSLYGVSPDIIFLRDDGWSLGAPAHLEYEAYRTWQNEWTAFARKGDEYFAPIAEYR